MRKTGISIIVFVSAFLILCSSMNSQAEDNVISIVNYSLKPVGYVSGNRFIQSIWNIELKNNEQVPHSFKGRIVFYDKDKNELKDVDKEVDIKAGETKKYSDAVLLEPEMAKTIATTKAFIEDIE